MKALIIDDENKARRLLSKLIDGTCGEIHHILEASNLEEGIEIIKNEKPNIVYLDIEMPKYSGLQILDLLEDTVIDFQIIFITAYNQYAVEAFKLSAIDYLLKPIDVNELKVATKKAVEVLNENSINKQLQDLRNAFNQLAVNKIALDVPKGIIFVSHDDIILFEADGMYTNVYLNNGNTELICKPLKHFVEQLENLSIFYKPHRSFLINLKQIKELSKRDGHYLIMSNNKTIPIAKDKRDEFMTVINEVFNI
ncbi:MAG: LytTR family DNA-binding domain-containing protein [Winogradskyella sp.]|uniref:LytR/AlgR family response regulator transcription factor n=1 Tax=Winogradskyella sp. TaxID=1883156 RepID=UPI0025D50742|nr:LytTR family DNA-binding domain-containing protein [Winogradskyella sp.]NRB60048.1 response regulator transcription factor [Winogradskyella sp.]